MTRGQPGIAGGVPTGTSTGVIGCQVGNLGLNAQVRYFSSGVYNINIDPAKGAVNSIDNNHMPSATYVGFSGDYAFHKSKNGKLQVYWAIDNLFDRLPPPTATSSNAGLTNSAFYDVVGRTYRLGFRFSPERDLN